MVWIKVTETEYLNADSITRFVIRGGSHDRNPTAVSIFCRFSELKGDVAPEMLQIWSSEIVSGKHGQEAPRQLANRVLIDLLNALESAKKNGEAIFDLKAFVDSCKEEELARLQAEYIKSKNIKNGTTVL
jgi:hypothetical protein